MANSAGSRKRIRTQERNRLNNQRLRTDGRTHIKKVIHAIAKNDYELASNFFKSMQVALDKLATKGIFSAKKVARHKSRLNGKIKALASKEVLINSMMGATENNADAT